MNTLNLHLVNIQTDEGTLPVILDGKIDWKNLPEYFAVKINWQDPTHAPVMVDEVVSECGNYAECFDEDEIDALCVAAIDAIPNGEEAVRKAILDCLYDLPGMDEYLFVRGTKEYKYGGEMWEKIKEIEELESDGDVVQ